MSVKVFQSRKVHREFPYRISSADFFDDSVYFGDEKGNAYRYPIRADDTEIMPKSVKDDPKQIGTKSKIDKIVAYSQTGSILMLSDEKLFCFDKNLTRAQAIREKVHDFAINISYGAPCNYGIVVVTRKKEGFIYNHNPAAKKFEESRDKFLLTELPTSMAYTKTHVILGFKKQYQILNSANSFSVNKIGLEVKGFSFVKVISKDQVLFFQQNVGIFMSTEGLPKERNPCVLNSMKPILDIGLSYNYCFILTDSSIEIFNTFDSKKFVPVQTIEINACKGMTNGRIFAYGRQQATYLYQIPFETQIRTLLNSCKIDQALQVLVQNVGENSQMINQLKLDAIWPLLRNLQFQKAKDIMKDVDFDIRQLVALFTEFMSVSKETLRPQKTMNSLVFDFLQERKQLKPQEMEKQTNDYKQKAKYLLKDILEFKRERIINQTSKQQQHLKEKVSFSTSKNSLIGVKLPPATLEEILEIIDYALIKWYLEAADFRSLDDFLKNNPRIYCKALFGEFQSEFKSNKLREYPTLVPRLYAAFGMTEQALEQWQKVSESKDDSKVLIACQEAVKLLSRVDNKDKMMKGLKWVLNKKPEIGMNLFKILPEGFVPSDQVIKHFQGEDSDISRTCLQKYLEIVVIDKNTDQERLHTKLISKYLENLFKARKKDSKQEVSTPQFVQRLAKMREFLRNPQARYASEVVLDKIKGCEWLLQDQIYLYSREKKHDQALQKLIQKQMYRDAQRYCEQNQQRTLTKYFTKLIKLYDDYAQGGKNSALMIKKDIMNFLKKYSSNTQLDPIQVMKLLPGDWMLNDDSGGGLYDFLESAITHTLHNRRSYNTAKYLSEMDFLNVEYDLAKAKLASVRLTLKKNCRVCERPILDKMFIVFPNGVVCHQTCVKKQKITVCPVTEQDFNKTFHG